MDLFGCDIISLSMASSLNFYDIYAKLNIYFSIRISFKNSTTKFFVITRCEVESIKAYLQRLKKKMLDIKSILELIATKALISGV